MRDPPACTSVFELGVVTSASLIAKGSPPSVRQWLCGRVAQRRARDVHQLQLLIYICRLNFKTAGKKFKSGRGRSHARNEIAIVARAHHQ